MATQTMSVSDLNPNLVTRQGDGTFLINLDGAWHPARGDFVDQGGHLYCIVDDAVSSRRINRMGDGEVVVRAEYVGLTSGDAP